MAEPAVDIFAEVARYKRDPLGFTYFAFDWGHGELEGKSPEVWQVAALARLGEQLQALPKQPTSEQWACVIREAIASGHGVGKSALFAWIVLWAMSTMVDCKGIVTANTETQLRTKTWATLQLWHRRCITRDWFAVTATAIHAKDPDYVKTWRIDAIPWSETNTEAFAGLHNEGKRVLVLFDESSGIPDEIWETVEGALTDANTEIIFVVAGNATRVKGAFVDTWTTRRHRWGFLRVDGRSVTLTNRVQIDEWEEDHGGDSDFFRVRVRGLPPSEDDESLIPIHLLEMAAARSSEPIGEMVWGVDVGRSSPDPSMVARRRGPVLYPLEKHNTRNGIQLAGILNAQGKDNPPAFANIDAIGVGSDVADLVTEKTAEGFDCVRALEVWSGGKADDPQRFGNVRAELFWRLVAWLKQPDADIPDDAELIQEATAVGQFRYDNAGRMFAMKKEDIKKIIKRSPNKLDALLLSFYRPKDLGAAVISF